MVPHHSGRKGALRCRQLEYYRMPLMVYLALDDPALTRAEYVRLAFATAPSDGEGAPCRVAGQNAGRVVHTRPRDGAPDAATSPVRSAY